MPHTCHITSMAQQHIIEPHSTLDTQLDSSVVRASRIYPGGPGFKPQSGHFSILTGYEPCCLRSCHPSQSTQKSSLRSLPTPQNQPYTFYTHLFKLLDAFGAYSIKLSTLDCKFESTGQIHLILLCSSRLFGPICIAVHLYTLHTPSPRLLPSF